MIGPYLARIEAHADPERARGMAAYHKADRPYLGVPNPVLNALTQDWRRRLDPDSRLRLADALWRADIHETRLAAAKLLTQTRIEPDAAVWALIRGWVPEFDAWAVSDHACMAGQKRLVAERARLDEVDTWTRSDHMWTRRAALVMTLPWARLNHPKPADLAVRERVLGWAARYADDRDWFIQKSVGWWLRDLSKHDPDRTRAWMAEHGTRLKPFARKEALRHLET